MSNVTSIGVPWVLQLTPQSAVNWWWHPLWYHPVWNVHIHIQTANTWHVFLSNEIKASVIGFLCFHAKRQMQSNMFPSLFNSVETRIGGLFYPPLNKSYQIFNVYIFGLFHTNKLVHMDPVNFASICMSSASRQVFSVRFTVASINMSSASRQDRSLDIRFPIHQSRPEVGRKGWCQCWTCCMNR